VFIFGVQKIVIEKSRELTKIPKSLEIVLRAKNKEKRVIRIAQSISKVQINTSLFKLEQAKTS